MVLQVIISIIISGQGVDIFYHYCGESGLMAVSLYSRANCGNDINRSGYSHCCAVKTHEEINHIHCCNNFHTEEKETLKNSQCSDEHKLYLADLTTTVSPFKVILLAPVETRLFHQEPTNDLVDKDYENYIRHKPPPIIKPFKKLYLFVNKKDFPSEPAAIS